MGRAPRLAWQATAAHRRPWPMADTSTGGLRAAPTADRRALGRPMESSRDRSAHAPPPPSLRPTAVGKTPAPGLAGDGRPPPANNGHPSQWPTSRPHRRRAGAGAANESPTRRVGTHTAATAAGSPHKARHCAAQRRFMAHYTSPANRGAFGGAFVAPAPAAGPKKRRGRSKQSRATQDKRKLLRKIEDFSAAPDRPAASDHAGGSGADDEA